MNTYKDNIYKEAIDILLTWVRGDCWCPCCGSYEFCDSDCTLADEDKSNTYERIESARYVCDQVKFTLEKLKCYDYAR